MKLKPSISPIATAALACAAAVMSSGAQACDDCGQPGKLFLQLDANRDGYISRSEAAAVRGFNRAFDDADENRDGKLSADEFIKAESIHQRQQVTELAADSAITLMVKAALIKELEMKAFDVGVETNQGRVLLSGTVDDRRQAQRVMQLALAVRGVRRVEDELKLK